MGSTRMGWRLRRPFIEGLMLVAFEGMEIFNTDAGGGGSTDDMVWTDSALEFL